MEDGICLSHPNVYIHYHYRIHTPERMHIAAESETRIKAVATK